MKNVAGEIENWIFKLVVIFFCHYSFETDDCHFSLHSLIQLYTMIDVNQIFRSIQFLRSTLRIRALNRSLLKINP